MSVAYNPSIVTNNLLVYVDPGNPKSYPGSGTTMFDLSGNGRNATIVGSPTFTSYYFDITSDSTYISLPSNSPGVGNFTYSIWVNFDALDSVDTLIENGSWTDTLLFRFETNTVTVYAEGALRGTFSWLPVINRWYNVVFTRQSSTVTMYVNGVITGTPFSMTTELIISNSNLWLMRSQHTTGQWTDGKVSAFLVYNGALSQDDVNQNFNALRGRFNV